MNNCQKYEDIILTDYLDGRASADVRQEVESHLQTCDGCRALLQNASTEFLTFKEARPIKVPGRIWAGIQQQIIEEKLGTGKTVSPLQGFFAKVAPFKLAGALAVLVLIGSLVFHQQDIQMASDDRDEYVVSLLASATTDEDSEVDDLGTTIEEYFL